MDITKVCQKIEELDSLITSKEKTDIETVRDCLHQPLTWLSKDLIKQNSWKRHVWLLLNTILPQWEFLLTSSKEDEKAITTTLLGKYIYQSTKNEKQEEVEEKEVVKETQELCLAMVQVSLPLILDSIQEQQRIENENIGSVQLLQIYSIQLKQMISTSMITIYFQQANHIQDISFFCSMLFSISSRLSNAFGLHHMVNADISNMDNTWYLDR